MVSRILSSPASTLFRRALCPTDRTIASLMPKIFRSIKEYQAAEMGSLEKFAENLGSSRSRYTKQGLLDFYEKSSRLMYQQYLREQLGISPFKENELSYEEYKEIKMESLEEFTKSLGKKGSKYSEEEILISYEKSSRLKYQLYLSSTQHPESRGSKFF